MNEHSYEFYKSLFDFIGDPVFVKDENHRLVFVNEAQCQVLGKSKEELIGISDYDLFPKHEADIFRARDSKVLQTGVEDINEETFSAPNLKTLTVLTRKQRFIDASGNMFIVGVFKDITAIRDVEAKLQLANETLEQKVKERTAELDLANEEMKVQIEQLNYLNRALEETARIESELQVARKIQMNYTPESPSIPGILLYGICLPAREIGGDYLDYFQNDNGDWVITIADVCGKGIPAALVMTSLRSCIRAEGRKAVSSKALLISANRLMSLELQREKSFITCLCIIISGEGNHMNFSRAGHPALVSYREKVRMPSALNTRGMALGMAAEDRFAASLEESAMDLASGDKIFAYTDGLNEAMNERNLPYGTDRLFKILNQNSLLKPEALVQRVLEDVKQHVQDERQHDDMTLLSIEKL